ncbi:RTA1-domain-containing protein [Lentithecium fluviatile CBS 122367]|uniref:RTA1-domain-containing protein n=1 Tax=Lentithecium fluviatile CBS 122367 TaxID=1168545 RepID=A0A6G1J902_9PLEO|nr:RTA1-domain-containing protein [Lentithecium fluviatile CBS 122367]
MSDEHPNYDYNPSVAGAVVAVIAFTGLLGLHIWRLWQSRTWFCIPLIIGALFEIVGYAARGACHNRLYAFTPFIIQTVLVLLAPILFAASVYMFLGRIMRATGRSSHSIIRPTWLTKIFVTGDVVCFITQGAGAAIMGNATAKKTIDLGSTIILVGLVVQVLIFGLFLAAGILFHKRMRKGPGSKSTWEWERYLVLLYAASLIITFRNVFRVVEYALGDDGYLLQNEWPIYVFDALPMAAVLIICSLWYVGNLASGADSQVDHVMLVPDGHNSCHERIVTCNL